MTQSHSTFETVDDCDADGACIERGRVLSIQSHVVDGYVGNRAATFPLQLLGFEVGILNSVQFSNHTGYPTFRGTRLDGAQLWDLIEGMQANHLLQGYTHLLTGYIGSPSFLETIIRTLKTLRQLNPDLIYVCDPVMGDQNKLYVSTELVDIYRNQVVQLAQILTPNQFECGLLTGVQIRSDDDAFHACDILHDKGVEAVVITSSFYGSDKDDFLAIVGSHRVSENGMTKRFKMSVPRIPRDFTGTGDLTAALLLAHTYTQRSNRALSNGNEEKWHFDLADACEKTVASVQAVLRRTCINSRNGDLRLIQSKRDIECPQVKIRAQSISRDP